MTKPPEPHATTADIKAIIAAKVQIAADLAAQAAKPKVFSTLSIPATPASYTAPYKSATIHPFPALSITPPSVAAATTPTQFAPPAAVDDVLTSFLDDYLPKLARDSQPFISAIRELFSPPFHVSELWTAAKATQVLGNHLTQMVSEAVAVGAPAVKGLDAEALVTALVQFLLHRYLSQYIPAWAYSVVLPAIVGTVKMIYETQVRPRLKGPRN